MFKYVFAVILILLLVPALGLEIIHAAFLALVVCLILWLLGVRFDR